MATWEREHDAALRAALEEPRSHFTRGFRCTGDVCPSCRNEVAGLCANCAPDMGGKLAAARAERALRHCPNGHELGSGKRFCGECGAAAA